MAMTAQHLRETQVSSDGTTPFPAVQTLHPPFSGPRLANHPKTQRSHLARNRKHAWREPGAGGRYAVTGYCSARRGGSGGGGGGGGGGTGRAAFRWRDVADRDVADTGAGVHAGCGFWQDDDAAADGDLLQFLLDGVSEPGRR